MKRVVLAILVAVCPLTACTDDGVEPQFEEAFTVASVNGMVLTFHPDVPTGGIDRWEYEFDATTVRGCNIERTYYATGWTLINDRTIRVQFGAQWEQYELVNYTGTAATGDLAGTFNYTSSPGVTMKGQFSQMTSTILC